MNIAIDVGSGITKVMWEDKRRHFMSVAGERKEMDDDGLILAESDGFSVTVEGKTFLVGEAAENGIHPDNRVNTRKEQWFKEPGYLAMLYAGISCAVKPEGKEKRVNKSIRLCTGLPQAQIGSQKDELIKMLSRKCHTFSANGADYKIRMKATDILVLPQPAGLFLSELARDASLKERGVTVIDVGTYTTDWCTYNKQQSRTFGTNGMAVGMSDIVEHLISRVSVDHDRRIDFAEASEALRTGRLQQGEGWLDVSSMTGSEVNRVAEKIAAKMVDEWEGVKHNVVIVGGGGGPVFLDSLSRQFPHAKIASEEEPFWSIANGYRLWLESLSETKAA